MAKGPKAALEPPPGTTADTAEAPASVTLRRGTPRRSSQEQTRPPQITPAEKGEEEMEEEEMEEVEPEMEQKLEGRQLSA